MVKEAELLLEREKSVLVRVITDLHFERHGDRWAAFGPGAYGKCLEDTEFHLGYLKEAVETESVRLFTDYVEWARVMLASRKISPEDLRLNLESMHEVLEKRLQARERERALDYLSQGVNHLLGEGPSTESWIGEAHPFRQEATLYLESLLKGDRSTAETVVDTLVERGVSLEEIYEHIFQMSQYEVGRLWQQNEITVAHEHFCTAATQNIMARLYPMLFGTPKRGVRMVSCSVANELHELGIRMVTDLFELHGWDTYYLGANLPDDQVCEAVREYDADLLAISITLPIRVSRAKRLIQRLRNRSDIAGVPVLVGGYPFVTVPDLWKRIGADGSAGTAKEAVGLGEQLVNRQRGGSA